MKSITEVYEQISAKDQVILEKQAAQLKQAEEEDAAGRIMARGFADELSKLAGGPGSTIPETPNNIGSLTNFKTGPGGSSGVNTAGQKVQAGGAGMFKAPAAPKSTAPAAPKMPGT